jgi:hypothetical protein
MAQQDSKSFNDNTSKNEVEETMPVTENLVTGEIVYGNPDALTNPESAFSRYKISGG